MIFKDGWHPAENDVENPQNEWQWTKKTATLSFKNPKKDVDALSRSTTPGRTCSRRRSRSRLKIGDQVVGHVRRPTPRRRSS